MSFTACLKRRRLGSGFTCLAMVAIGIASLAGTSGAAITDGLKAYYDFDQSSGTTVPIVQGVAGNGTLQNPDGDEWTTGRFGNAMDFDGVNDHVNIPSGYIDTINGDDTHTVSMWFNADSVNNQMLLDVEGVAGVYDYFLELGDNSSYSFHVGVGGGGSTFRSYVFDVITVSTWHHVAFVKTGPGDSGDLYFDGALQTNYTGAVANTPSLSNFQGWDIGVYQDVQVPFDGAIDEVTFWDRSLSAAEVSQLYASGRSLGQQPSADADPIVVDLMAYYDFDESSGTTVPIVLGAANSGNLVNMTGSEWTSGRFGNALDLVGSDDHVNIPSGYIDTINGDDTHTVSMWFNARSVANLPMLLDIQGSAGGFDFFFELGDNITSSFYLGVGGSYRTYAFELITLNAWHHVAFVKTGAGDSGDLYIDGALKTPSSGSIASTPTLSSSEGWDLGIYESNQVPFDGLLDDVAFWRRDLSPAEVQQVFNAGQSLYDLIFPAPPTGTVIVLR